MKKEDLKKNLLKMKYAIAAGVLASSMSAVDVQAADSNQSNDTTIQTMLGETNQGSAYPYFYYEPTGQFYIQEYVAFTKLPLFVHKLMQATNTKVNILDGIMDIENFYKLSTTNMCDGLYDGTLKNIYVEATINYELMNQYLMSSNYFRYGEGRNIQQISELRNVYIMYHEIGHMVDRYVTGYNYSPQLLNIINSERENFKKTTLYRHELLDGGVIHVSDDGEFLACAFAAYCLYPEDLQKNCPGVFQYMKDVENYYNNLYGIIDQKTIVKK